MEVIDKDWIMARLTGKRGERARLAEAMGIDNDKLSKTLKGLRRVQPEEIPSVLAFFESEDTLPAIVDRGQPASGGGTLVPIYDVSAAAGPGVVVDEYLPVATNLSFPPDYLRTITNTKSDSLAIISVVGASMSPTLHHDDIVMVDMTKTRWAFDGIYVMQIDGLLKVKRIRRSEREEWVTLRSDNPQVPDEDVPMIDVTVIGRVVWSGRKEA